MTTKTIKIFLAVALALSVTFSNGINASAAITQKYKKNVSLTTIQHRFAQKGSGKMITFNWKIPYKMTFSSHYFHMKKGEKILAMVDVLPNNKKIRMGIANADPHIICAEGTGVVTYEFTVPKTDDYKFFVKNMTKTTILAVGAYNT